MGTHNAAGVSRRADRGTAHEERPIELTKAERRILVLLADRDWHPESHLRTTWGLLARLYMLGLVDGAMTKAGATPADRMWKLLTAP